MNTVALGVAAEEEGAGFAAWGAAAVAAGSGGALGAVWAGAGGSVFAVAGFCFFSTISCLGCSWAAGNFAKGVAAGDGFIGREAAGGLVGAS